MILSTIIVISFAVLVAWGVVAGRKHATSDGEISKRLNEMRNDRWL